MPFYIGENKIVDRYIGDKLVIAAYKGETKYFDAYSEITGTLPIIFKSRAAVALKNYRIYGTENGAGVETENLWNGLYANGYVDTSGTIYKVSNNSKSIIIPCEPNTTYTVRRVNNSNRYTISTSAAYPTDNMTITSIMRNSPSTGAKTFTTPSDAAYIIVFISTETTTCKVNVCAGSTAPTSYIPYGFKLPLMISSGAQSQDYPLYIGPSKLGAEEYVDFGGQKVWKRTENLFNKDTITRGINLSATSVYKSDAAGCSDYIKVIPGEDYYFNRVRGIGAYYSCVEYDASKAPLRNRILSGSTASGVITMNADAYYIRVNITLSLLSTIYVCRGTEPLENVPPYYIPTDPPVPLPPINAYQGENTLSSTETLGEVTVKGRIKERPIVYGWHVDPSTSDPAQAVTYLADAVGKTPAAMGSETFSYGDWSDAFFMPKPCMLRSDGTVDYYLDSNDYTKKADGTASDVANASFDGNAMMEWPLIWYKFEVGAADGEGYFYCSDKQVDNSYKCWCNYDANDNIIDHFYTAIYNGTGTDKMRSLSGIQLTPANGNGLTTGQQEVTRATANNTTRDVEWYTDVYSDRQLISALLILMSKCLDDQAAYGRGLDTGAQTTAESYITGTLNDKGLFYGVTANGNSAVKVFGMENWFGCKWQRTAGLIGGANDVYWYKLTYGTADGSTVKGYNANGRGYLTADGVLRPANNYVTKTGVGKHGLLPKETAAVSFSSYYGVYYYNGTGYALFGGSSGSGRLVGSLAVHLNSGFSYSTWPVGASLSCKPTKKS